MSKFIFGFETPTKTSYEAMRTVELPSSGLSDVSFTFLNVFMIVLIGKLTKLHDSPLFYRILEEND